jgi:predicted 2-oxoglutarate/Fe(II)-dependent dioxygenase YbiX
MNIGLGCEFEGGELAFHGVRGTQAEGERDDSFRYTPTLGRALIHLGRHLHEVLPVTSGDRHQLIMWARASEMRAGQVRAKP